jgi:hypothetical protein
LCNKIFLTILFSKKIIFENSLAKLKSYFRFLDIFVIFRLCSLLLWKKYMLYANIIIILIIIIIIIILIIFNLVILKHVIKY